MLSSIAVIGLCIAIGLVIIFVKHLVTGSSNADVALDLGEAFDFFRPRF